MSQTHTLSLTGRVVSLPLVSPPKFILRGMQSELPKCRSDLETPLPEKFDSTPLFSASWDPPYDGRQGPTHQAPLLSSPAPTLTILPSLFLLQPHWPGMAGVSCVLCSLSFSDGPFPHPLPPFTLSKLWSHPSCGPFSMQPSLTAATSGFGPPPLSSLRRPHACHLCYHCVSARRSEPGFALSFISTVASRASEPMVVTSHLLKERVNAWAPGSHAPGIKGFQLLTQQPTGH